MHLIGQFYIDFDIFRLTSKLSFTLIRNVKGNALYSLNVYISKGQFSLIRESRDEPFFGQW